MELSKRLQTIADMVNSGNRVADVGCDHGFVSIYLVQKQIAPKVYAMDLRPGPLARAREHIENYGYSKYIETRLSDGIAALKPKEADAMVVAGMGGRLMAKILSDGMEKIMEMKELVLQPQSELGFFRAYLRAHSLTIVAEDMVKEEGKFYPIMKVMPEKMADAYGVRSAREVVLSGLGERRQVITDAYGPFLLESAHPVLQEYLACLQKRNREIMVNLSGAKEQTALRRAEIEQELSDIEMCFSLF